MNTTIRSSCWLITLVLTLLLSISLLPARDVSAQAVGNYEPQLFKDINPDGAANPAYLTEVNGTLYFAADDGTHGRELWKSDGTPEGTTMVEDIYPGSTGSEPDHLVAANKMLYFAANDGTNGKELWQSDGTPEGTRMLKDINPGSSSSSPQELIDVNTFLFFAAWEGNRQWALWMSDGTENGTKRVKLFGVIWPEDRFDEFITYDNTPFFVVSTETYGAELWKSDGTEAGTVIVKDIHPEFGSNPGALVIFNDMLYFTAKDSQQLPSSLLWQSDGTEAGTQPVPGLGGENDLVIPTIVFDNMIFGLGYDETHGFELWKTDGTAAGTQLVKDINGPLFASGSAYEGSSNPEHMVVFNDSLIFSAYDRLAGRELWQSDGTEAGTRMIADIHKAPAGEILSDYSSHPEHLVVFNDTLFFTADDGEHGTELWSMPIPSVQLNYPDGAPGSIFRVTVPDLPAGNSAAISARGPGDDSFIFLGNLPVPEDGTLEFWLMTLRADDLVGDFTIRIVVETGATSLAETITREVTITLANDAPLRNDQPAGDLPELNISPSDDPGGDDPGGDDPGGDDPGGDDPGGDDPGGDDPVNTEFVYLPLIFGPVGN